jgi:hypothetical protein
MNSKVEEYIEAHEDWRGELLSNLRDLINKTAPGMTEDFKWGVPVWTHDGLVCAISAFKDHVKINFLKGAYLSDPNGLFNSGLDSKEHRSINFAQDDKVNKEAIIQLVNQAKNYNKGK